MKDTKELLAFEYPNMQLKDIKNALRLQAKEIFDKLDNTWFDKEQLANISIIKKEYCIEK